jgi:hypothetical protein
MQMIALAGTLGTGLFLGSGKAIAHGGPAGALIAYAHVGTIVYCMCERCPVLDRLPYATHGTWRKTSRPHVRIADCRSDGSRRDGRLRPDLGWLYPLCMSPACLARMGFIPLTLHSAG